jgi:hypothetical protein
VDAGDYVGAIRVDTAAIAAETVIRVLYAPDLSSSELCVFPMAMVVQILESVCVTVRYTVMNEYSLLIHTTVSIIIYICNMYIVLDFTYWFVLSLK